MPKKNKLSQKKLIGIKTNELNKDLNPSKYISTGRLSPSQYISNIRYTISPEFYPDVLTDIEKLPYSITHLLTANLKKRLNDLDSKKLDFINFESEYHWAKNIILKNLSALNKYVILSNTFSNKLFIGQIKEAQDVLKAIESEFGQSLWLLKNKIAILQLVEGLESQKKFTQSSKIELRNGGLGRFIIHWVSVRNEPQTSYSRFINQIEPIINRLNPVTQFGYKEYCEYHLIGKTTLDPDEMIQILRLEFSTSLIDYYEAFVSLIRLLAINESEKLKSKVFHLLKDERFNSVDERINVLAEYIGSKEMKCFENNILNTLYDLFLKAEYQQAYKLSIEILSKFPSHPILLIVIPYIDGFRNVSTEITSLAEDAELKTQPTFRELIIKNLSDVIKYGLITSAKQNNELSKIALNFGYFSWTSAINIILDKEAAVFKMLEKQSSLSALKAGCIHPALIDCFVDLNNFELYKKYCLDNFGTHLSTLFFISPDQLLLSPDLKSVSKEHLQLLKGFKNFKELNFDKAIYYGDLLKESKVSYFERRGFGLTSHSLLNLKKLDDVCTLAAYCYIHHHPYYPFLPLSEIAESIKPGTSEWRALSSNIALPILFDGCVKHVNKKYEIERRFAYEDFLLKNGIFKPSQLKPILNQFDTYKIIYYLRHICIETIMDTSGSFEGGSQEVVSERIEICKILSSIDKKNKSLYQVEISDLVRRQIIASRREEVDQSRIFVDIQSIKEWARNEMHENFDRYIAYLKSGIGSFVPENKLTKDKIENSNIEVPFNETSELLRFMMEEITESYLSVEFGLDRFLSTRIRHGIFENHIRKAVQNHNLITKRQSKNGPYLRNNFWLDKLKISESGLIKPFEKTFSKFSESFDDLLFEITDEWLQVKKNLKPKGLFDFGFNDNEIDKFAKVINTETTLKQFIDYVISLLDSILIFRLAEIREQLNEKAKSKAKTLLIELQEFTARNTTSCSVELQNSISQARTDLQAQFNTAIEWFVPSATGNSSPYYIQEAMMVAETIIKDANPAFKIHIKEDDDAHIAIHGQLPIFVDIFINIFENVVKRSGLEYPEANVTIWTDTLKDDFQQIYFKVVNRLTPEIDIQQRSDELKSKKDLLEKKLYNQYLATEQNSGLFKIHKSVMDLGVLELKIKPTMDFGIEQDSFQITISVPFKIFMLKDDILENNSL